MWNHRKPVPKIIDRNKDDKDFSWYDLHASEMLVEKDITEMVALLRFLTHDPHTFYRLRDTVLHKAYDVIDRFSRLEYVEPPTGTSYNNGH